MNLLKSFPSKSRWCAAAVFIAANLAALPASAAAIPVQSVQTDANGVTLTMSPGKMKLTVCSDSIVRVMYSPTATLPAGQDFAVTKHSWPATSFRVADFSEKITVTTRKLKIAVDKATVAVQFLDSSNKLLLAEPADGDKTITRVTVNGEASYQPGLLILGVSGHAMNLPDAA